jgi:hypothetical protein
LEKEDSFLLPSCRKKSILPSPGNTPAQPLTSLVNQKTEPFFRFNGLAFAGLRLTHNLALSYSTTTPSGLHQHTGGLRVPASYCGPHGGRASVEQSRKKSNKSVDFRQIRSEFFKNLIEVKIENLIKLQSASPEHDSHQLPQGVID